MPQLFVSYQNSYAFSSAISLSTAALLHQILSIQCVFIPFTQYQLSLLTPFNSSLKPSSLLPSVSMQHPNNLFPLKAWQWEGKKRSSQSLAHLSLHLQLLLPPPIANTKVGINQYTWIPERQGTGEDCAELFQNKKNSAKWPGKTICLHRGNQKRHRISEQEMSHVDRWEASQSPVIQKLKPRMFSYRDRLLARVWKEDLRAGICATSQQEFPCPVLAIYSSS